MDLYLYASLFSLISPSMFFTFIWISYWLFNYIYLSCFFLDNNSSCCLFYNSLFFLLLSIKSNLFWSYNISLYLHFSSNFAYSFSVLFLASSYFISSDPFVILVERFFMKFFIAAKSFFFLFSPFTFFILRKHMSQTLLSLTFFPEHTLQTECEHNLQ